MGNRKHTAFTLVELLITIAIIAVLISILFPLVGRMRESAREADTRSLLMSIEAACQAYYQDHGAYPGVFSSSYIARQDQSAGDEGLYQTAITGHASQAARIINEGQVQNGNVTGNRITGNENAVLSLLGGLKWNNAENRVEFDPAQVGQGAMNLNRARPGRTKAYMQNTNLSKGLFEDWNRTQIPNASKDTEIPEFVDRWPSPMPFLMMRARRGAAANLTGSAPPVSLNNNVVVSAALGDGTNNALNGQYNLIEILPYTQSAIGANPDVGAARGMAPKDYRGRTFDPLRPHGLASVDVSEVLANQTLLRPKEVVPFGAYNYFVDPATDNPTLATNERLKRHRARKLDGIIIISAGRDRVYGTADDVTNFGSVVP